MNARNWCISYFCTFPGRAVQSISPWMYVTMMMTDQIPLDLAPPPLLNGEVPLMPHMVNGDATQQVNTRSRWHEQTHTHVCNVHFLFNKHVSQMNVTVYIKQYNAHFSVVSWAHTTWIVAIKIAREKPSCVTEDKLLNTYRYIQMHYLFLWRSFKGNV